MNKRHYEHTLPNIRGSLSNTYFDAVVVFIVFLIYVKHPVVSDSGARQRSAPARKVFGKNTGAERG